MSRQNSPYSRTVDALRFSDEQLESIRSGALEALANGTEEGSVTGPEMRAGGKRLGRKGVPKRAAVGLLAAAIALSIGGLAVAGGVSGITPTELVAHVFGDRSAQDGTLVEQVSTPIGISKTVDGITITLDSFVCDQYNAMLVFSIVGENGEALDWATEPMHGTPSATFQRIYVESDTLPPASFPNTTTSTSWAFYDFNPGDNALQFVFRCNSLTGKPLCNKTFKVLLGGLYQFRWPTDADASTINSGSVMEIISEGPWTFKLDVSQMAKLVELPVSGYVYHGDARIHVVRAVVSPLGMTVWFNGSGPTMLEFPVGFNVSDGSSIEVGGSGSVSSPNPDLVSDWDYIAFLQTDEIVNLDDVVSVTLGDMEIPLE